MALCKVKHQALTTHVYIIMIILVLHTSCATLISNDLNVGIECITIPRSEFLGSLKELGQILNNISSTLNEINNNITDFERGYRHSSAISSCLEMFDLSVEELSWCISASESPQGTYVIQYNFIFLE